MFGPLNQFDIIFYYIFRLPPLCPVKILYFSLSNFSISWILFLFFITCIISFYSNIIDSSIYEMIIENIFLFIQSLINANFKNKNNMRFFTIFFVIFIIILFFNLFGMIPYLFTVTSHLAITLFFAGMIFFSVNFFSIKNHKLQFFTFFIVKNVSGAFAMFMFIIEVISYSFRVLSLALRLFINMMAGHALLKVFAIFSYNFYIQKSLIMFGFGLVPNLLLYILINLEIVIACLQAYVFTILSILYYNDGYNLSH